MTTGYDKPPGLIYALGGGLNQGIPETEIEGSEHPLLENFYPFGRKLIRRGGIRLINDQSYFEDITSLFQYKNTVGDWTLIIGGVSSIGYLTSTPAYLVIPTAADVSILPVSLPWCFFQYNDILYACRPGGGPLLRMTPTSIISKAGVIAPTIPPVLAQGAVGDLASGDYVGVFTWVTAIGGESNPSPKSNTLTLAASRMIDWSSIENPTDAKVVGKNLYRTLVDQINEYFFVANIPDTVTTTFIGDNVLEEDTGVSVSFQNFVPPDNLIWACIFNERGFFTDGTDLMYSPLFNPEAWTGTTIPVFKEDGNRINVLHVYGDRLIIGKTNGIHYLTGTDRSTFRLSTLSDKHGCVAPHSMKSAENILFWFGTGKNFYRSDGNNVVGIADIKVKRVIEENITDANQHLISAETFPERSWYVVTIPESELSANGIVIVYNYRTDAWTTFEHSVSNPYFLAEVFDANYGRQLYAPYGNRGVAKLYDPTYGGDDFNFENPAPITARLLTKQEDAGTYMGKAMRRVHLLCSRAAEEITLKAYRDGRSVPNATRTASLDIDNAWKDVNLSQLADPGSTIQLGIEYSGEAAIELEAIGLDIEQVDRPMGQPQ